MVLENKIQLPLRYQVPALIMYTAKDMVLLQLVYKVVPDFTTVSIIHTVLSCVHNKRMSTIEIRLQLMKVDTKTKIS